MSQKELLRVEHLKKYFQTPRGTLSAVEDVSFRIEERQTLGVVGESGCGKSTLAKLLFQYYPDYTGSILFNGQQLRGIDRQSLYQRVGYIAQTTYLFNDTLRSNICWVRISPKSS